jgi:NAD(P)H-nitrite reductase large subunit
MAPLGTQDSLALVSKRKDDMGQRMPHKFVKLLAVSGCPRNCAEASIKDLWHYLR